MNKNLSGRLGEEKLGSAGSNNTSLEPRTQANAEEDLSMLNKSNSKSLKPLSDMGSQDGEIHSPEQLTKKRLLQEKDKDSSSTKVPKLSSTSPPPFLSYAPSNDTSPLNSEKAGRLFKASSFGFVDIKKLEHSARILQKNIKLIIDEAPKVSELNQMINNRKTQLDSLTYDSLKNNRLVHLAAQLKSLHESGALTIFDEILENNISNKEIGEIHVEGDSESELDFTGPQPSSPSNPVSPETELGYVSGGHYAEIVETKDEKVLSENIKDNYPELPLIKDPHLYARVFIHKSTINNKSYLYQSELISSHNERLEFLGDSVLNNVATIILYERYPAAPEGELSKMRSILVNNVTLAEFSINYGFDRKLKSNINDAILRQGKQKIFADIFEAYVGALAIEHNLEFAIIKEWLYKLFYSRLQQFDADIRDTEEVNKDAKSELYSLVGTAAFHPTYNVKEIGDGASKPFKVDCVMGNEILGTGIAPGLKEAGLRAAMMALKNKPLLEKFIQVRVNTDKMYSMLPQKSASVSGTSPSVNTEIPSTNIDFELPLKDTSGMEFDSDARNKLYAIVSKNFNLIPEYVCNETEEQLFVAQLKVNNVVLAFASDISKKKAMAKAAKLVLDKPEVLNVARPSS